VSLGKERTYPKKTQKTCWISTTARKYQLLAGPYFLGDTEIPVPIRLEMPLENSTF